MTIKQLQNVLNLKDNQYVRVHDHRTQRTIDSVEGWCFEPDYEYDGFNYDEIKRILSLRVVSAEIKGDWLHIHAH